MMRFVIGVSTLFPAVLMGCQQTVLPTEPLRQSVEVIDDFQFRVLWESCQRVLRSHLFTIDREDLRSRVISTYPETSQHFWEFWRQDVRTPYDWFEASMHTMRRSVTIQLTKSETAAQYQIDVQVNKEQYHARERQMNNSAAALRAFSYDVPTTSGKKFQRSEDEYWTSHGRDGEMEKRLLQKIFYEYQKSLNRTAQDQPTSTQPENPEPENS